MTQSTKIRWHLIFLVSFGSLVLLVLAHVLFVAYYSHLMDPVVHDQEHYRQFAQYTGAPFVFFFAPLPIFLLVRWVGRKAEGQAMTHAILIAAISVLLDVTIVTLGGQLAFMLTPGVLLAHVAKVVAALFGGWMAQRDLAVA